MKSAEERMYIVDAYLELGTFRAAAERCGTTHKTVRRVVEQWKAGTLGQPRLRPPRTKNTDPVQELIAAKVRATDGRISAKRLLPAARAAGYAGSARNFRRAVAQAKARWRRQRRVFQPWRPSIGEHLVIDWSTKAGLQMFCAIAPWSRWRWVRFAGDQRRETTLRLLGECLEGLGGVPAIVLTDRMGCLKASVVANVVVPHPDYVRFATHFGFRPDFCESYDAPSKGVVERLVGYAADDLVVPAGGWASVEEANQAAIAWCEEVNGQMHSEIAAVPAERLVQERQALRPLPQLRAPLRRGVLRKVDRLSCVRIGSARYSVPVELVGRHVEVIAAETEVIVLLGAEEIARHRLVAPGECSIMDDHYGGRRVRPARQVRPRSAAERAFLGLGEVAERFLRAAAVAGTPRLAAELEAIVALEHDWGRNQLCGALERAVAFRRFRAADVRAILAAGPGAPEPRSQGEALVVNLPAVPVRSLDDYRLERLEATR
ncbi:MAG: IS21 family transposase [Actinomycetota bacterium]